VYKDKKDGRKDAMSIQISGFVKEMLDKTKKEGISYRKQVNSIIISHYNENSIQLDYELSMDLDQMCKQYDIGKQDLVHKLIVKALGRV